MILKAKHSKVYLCCEDEVSGSGSTRPDTNSAPGSTLGPVSTWPGQLGLVLFKVI